MTTQIVNGNRVFGQPELDGGLFFSNGSNVLIVARQFSVQTLMVMATQSAGVLPILGTLSSTPLVQLYQTPTSSGATLQASTMSAGVQYEWMTFGVGG
jgi:hypothetical protein